MSFETLGLIEPLLRALRDAGYETPTSIQEQAIPHVREGRDVLGCAQTGTGKTAAFALPILQHLYNNPKSLRPTQPRVLVLAPTRELAAQIDESFHAYGKHMKLWHTVVFGGVGYDRQIRSLRAGVHVLVATPGRLIDLMERRTVDLSAVEVLVLDEADRMLDMGFIHAVRQILREIPKQRQTLFFSATMPREIRSLADDILSNPANVAVTPVASTVDKIAQSVHRVEKADKRALLLHLVMDPAVTRGLVFTRTKHMANRVADHLAKEGVQSAAIHGNKSQGARERALSEFKSGKVRILVATDIAARGIDVDGISHVINFDLPNEPESYVHRIGRTARAGASGIAWSFCDRDEREFLRDIERTIKMTVPVVESHPYMPGDTKTPRAYDPAPRADVHRNEGRSNEARRTAGRSNEGRSNAGRRDQGAPRNDVGRSDNGAPRNDVRRNDGRRDDVRRDDSRRDNGRGNEYRAQGDRPSNRPDNRGNDNRAPSNRPDNRSADNRGNDRGSVDRGNDRGIDTRNRDNARGNDRPGDERRGGERAAPRVEATNGARRSFGRRRNPNPRSAYSY